MALILTALGWSFATVLYGPGLDGGLEQEALGLLLSSLGVMLGLGACTVALIGTARERRWTWFAVLLLAAALPLVAGPAVYDLAAVVIGPASASEAAFTRLLDLDVLLPPIGCAVLVAFEAWSARRRQRLSTMSRAVTALVAPSSRGVRSETRGHGALIRGLYGDDQYKDMESSQQNGVSPTSLPSL